MLERPASRAARERRRRYRERVKRGAMVVRLEADQELVGFLIRMRWLENGEVIDARKVTDALRRMLQDAVGGA
jgi:hypothetical protein